MGMSNVRLNDCVERSQRFYTQVGGDMFITVCIMLKQIKEDANLKMNKIKRKQWTWKNEKIFH